jgi:hypothetical protein
LDKEG